MGRLALNTRIPAKVSLSQSTIIGWNRTHQRWLDRAGQAIEPKVGMVIDLELSDPDYKDALRKRGLTCVPYGNAEMIQSTR